MQLIVADELPLTGPEYDSPEAALSSAQRFDEDRQKEELPRLIGRQVDSVEFGTEFIRMYCGRHGISCFHNEGGVDYEVFSGVPGGPAGPGDLSDDIVEVRLRGLRIAWEPRKILHHLVGQTLRNVFLSPAGLFLYVSNIDVLRVTALLDIERSKPFLFWQFTD